MRLRWMLLSRRIIVFLSILSAISAWFWAYILYFYTPHLNYLATTYFDACDVNKYLSDSEVIGFYPICVIRNSLDMLEVIVYFDGRAEVFSFEVSSDYNALRKALETILELESISLTDTPSVKYPWEMYTPDGSELISSLVQVAPENVGEYKVSFVFKGGSFIWPGVKVGYRQIVEGFHGLDNTELITLSLTPLVFKIESFLSNADCNHIILEGTPYLESPKISKRNPGSFKHEFSNSRCYLPSNTDPVIQQIDRRVASITRQPTTHLENTELLHYKVNQGSQAHLDLVYYMQNASNDTEANFIIDNGRRNRLATMLFYLSNAIEGGETVFHYSEPNLDTSGIDLCARGLNIIPAKGDAILFYNFNPDGQYDPYSIHESCPVRKGEKWAANKWVWNRPLEFNL